MCQEGSTVQLSQIKSLDKKIQGRVQLRSEVISPSSLEN